MTHPSTQQKSRIERAVLVAPFATLLVAIASCAFASTMPFVVGAYNSWLAKQPLITTSTNTLSLIMPWFWLPAVLLSAGALVVNVWLSWWLWNHREDNDVDGLRTALAAATAAASAGPAATARALEAESQLVARLKLERSWLVNGQSIKCLVTDGIVHLDTGTVTFTVQISHFGGIDCRATDLVIQGLLVNGTQVRIPDLPCLPDGTLPGREWRVMLRSTATFRFSATVGVVPLRTAAAGKRLPLLGWNNAHYKLSIAEGAEEIAFLGAQCAQSEARP